MWPSKSVHPALPEVPRTVRRRAALRGNCPDGLTANLRSKILEFRGFDSGMIISSSRGEIPRPVGKFPESLSRRI